MISAAILALSVAATPPGASEAEVNEAIARVKEIVNQPVAAFPRDLDAQVSVYRPGWFHPGAIKPDFSNVDVRKTQEFPYARHEYVTSDVTPSVMFRGRDLEFNSMTKYFYTDRSLPKKRLTEEEMLEVNRLYRIIALGQPPAPLPPTPAPPPAAADPALTKPLLYVLAGLLALAAALWLYRRRSVVK